MADSPIRKIVHREYSEPKYAKPGTGSVTLTLECGHKIRRKLSCEPRRTARCFDCTKN